MGRRLHGVIRIARHYASADLPRWPDDYGDDDVGQIVRAMDHAVQEQRRRLSDLGRHRARMEAILAEMAEGVLIVDRQGRVQLINEVARRLLPGRVTRAIIKSRRPHPGIVEELTGLTSDRPTRSKSPRGRPPRLAPRDAGVGRRRWRRRARAADITALRTADRIRRDFVANVSHECGRRDAVRIHRGARGRHARPRRAARILASLPVTPIAWNVVRDCSARAHRGAARKSSTSPLDVDHVPFARGDSNTNPGPQLVVEMHVAPSGRGHVRCLGSCMTAPHLFETRSTITREGQIELSSQGREQIALSVADQGPAYQTAISSGSSNASTAWTSQHRDPGARSWLSIANTLWTCTAPAPVTNRQPRARFSRFCYQTRGRS